MTPRAPRASGRLLAAGLLLTASLAGAQPLVAQQVPLRGVVRSQEGAPIAGALARAEPSGRRAATDSAGRFALEVTGDTLLVVGAAGYGPERARLPGPREVVVTLVPARELDALSVTASRARPLLDARGATTGGALERAELEALPTDQRNPLSLASNVPGVAQATGFFGDAPPLSLNGGNSLYTQYTLDGLDDNEGFLGGPRVEFPLGALERLDVAVNGYSAALGRSPTGVVNLASRAGGPRWSGEVFGYWRPGIPLDARPKLTPPGTDPEGFRRVQLGGGAGGPLATGRTFAHVAAEYTSENEDRIGSTAQTAFVGTERRETVKLAGRLDHGWSPGQTTTLRVAVSDVRRAGQGTGVVVPEADITTRRIGSLTALLHRSRLAGGRGSNTAAAQLGTFRWFFPPTRSDFSRPQVTVLAPDGTTVEAVVGSSNFVFDESETQLQLRDVVEADLGRGHVLAAGADVVTAWFRLRGSQTNPNGAYEVYDDGNIVAAGRFLSIADIPADVRVKSYTIDASPQQVNLRQTVVGAFVEDRWRPSARLTVTAGLRWDYDDITSRGESRPDLDNVQPRLAFNWLLSGRSVLRGSLGAFTGKFPYTIYSDAVQFGPQGNATVRFEGDSAPAYLQGKTPAQLQAERDRLPPREIRRTFALGLEQPWSLQATLGWQVQLGDRWALAVDAVWNETRHLPRSVDLNPIGYRLTPADSVDRPATFGDTLRPVRPVAGSYRRLTTTETGGRARYRALYVALRRQLSPAWSVDANWTWSHAQDDTEDINFNATQGNCFARDRRDAVTGQPCTSDEWADAINDRRHKVTLRALWALPRRLALAVIADLQTGQPVNRVAFFRDLDGSGPIFGNGFVGNQDRFAGVPRNGERLPAFFELSASAAWRVPLGAQALEVRGDVFNVLNGTEWGGFANGIPGGGSRTQVGRPGDPIVLRSPGRPRQVQLSARYLF